MKFISSDKRTPELIEGMCRWAGPRIGESFDPSRTTGISVLCENGRAVVLYTHHVPQTDIRMHVAAEGYWLSRTALSVFFGYPFQGLGVRRATALVEKKNKKARTLDEKLGFRYEGCVRYGAENGDHLILYGMLKPECKWLKEMDDEEYPRRAA